MTRKTSPAQHLTKSFIWLRFMVRESISIAGLLEATKTIFIWTGKTLLLLVVSVICSLLFWYIRALIPTWIHHSYKTYVMWLDSLPFGIVPCLWIQQHLRNQLLDILFRWVHISYMYAILLGPTFAFIIRGETKRYLLSFILTISIGLLIHYMAPTQPPWMAVEGVIRINGDYFTHLDKNLTAAMPSIHQAIICLAACLVWKYGIHARVVAISYNIMMGMALVYLGEHFIVDLIAGILIATGSWFIAKRIVP